MKKLTIMTILTLLVLALTVFSVLPALAEGQAGTTLSADKTAEGQLTRIWNWSIEKSVTPQHWDLFVGDSGTSRYTVTVTKEGYTDVVSVSGEVCVTNGGERTTENLTIYDHVQYKTGSGQYQDLPGASVTLTPGELAPGEARCYDYEIEFEAVPGATYRNVATITITNHSGHLGEPFGPEPKADFSVPATPTGEVNAEIHVTDTNGMSWGPVSETTTWTYEKTFTVAGTYGNVATIVETGQEAGAEVTVSIYSLDVSKDADDTSFNRYWSWTIDKWADQSALTLSVGQQFLVNYEVTVDASYVDDDFAVSGNIYVYNPAPMPAKVNGVSDVVSPDVAATVDCGVVFPHVLPAGQTLQCSYSADLPDASSRTNTATSHLQNYAYDYQLNATPAGETVFVGTAEVVFGATPEDEIDECIDVSDTNVGFLGTVCANEAPKTFAYSLYVGPYSASGTYYVRNTASFITNDMGIGGSDDWTVIITVPCAGGCTLTQGYWKTHSEYGPAPYDDTWDAKDGGDAEFFSTGLSYYQILWTVPKGGNAYYILAHQYIAAELNQLNGADVPVEVQSAMDQAEALLIKYQDDLSIPKKGGDRELAISLYELLGAYNNGYIGPGHCSE
jgi:hypothetical protein